MTDTGELRRELPHGVEEYRPNVSNRCFSELRFGLLGPLTVWTSDPTKRPDIDRQLSENKVRVMLSALLLRANQFLTSRQLETLLWEDPPESARSNIRSYLARVRKVMTLADSSVSRLSSVRRGCGGLYRLKVSSMELDADVFVRLVRRASDESRAERFADAAATLQAALALWRGPASGACFAESERLRAQLDALDHLRLVAQEDLLSLRLRIGEHRLLVPEIRTLLSDHPTREALWASLMRAHYYAGDVAAASNTFHECRRLLARELGVNPGTELQRLHQSILCREDKSV